MPPSLAPPPRRVVRLHNSGAVMGRGLSSRSIAIAATSFFVALALSAFSQTANAQTAYCWINAKTGTPVPISDVFPQGSHPSDDNHASIPSGRYGPGGD